MNGLKTFDDTCPNFGNVPMDRLAVAHGRIRKTVDFSQRKLAIFNGAANDSAGFGAEIDGKNVHGSKRPTRYSARSAKIPFRGAAAFTTLILFADTPRPRVLQSEPLAPRS